MKNSKKILLLLVFCIAANLAAQTDTLFFNTDWKKTVKADAAFFRPLPLEKEGNVYKVKDYYINGNLQMEGFWSDVENETLQGKAIYYFESGKKSRESEYKNGSLDGLTIQYTKKGKVKAKGINKNNKPYSGAFIVYRLLRTYDKGILNGEEISYAANDKIVTRGINKNGAHWNGDFTQTQTKKTEYTQGRNDGITASYYDLNLEQKKQFYTVVNGTKEGEEVSFSPDGKVKAKGINKNNMPWSGTFYNEILRTLISYKEGKFHGMFTKYNTKGKVLSGHEYKNGKISGKVISTGLFANRTCECKYKDQKPIIGKKCEGYDVYEYANKQLIKITSYHKDAETKPVEIQFFENELKTKTVVYLDNKTYALIYKNGEAYSGQYYERLSGSLTTFKEGVKNGPFFNNEKYKGYTASGNYKKGQYNGKIKFENLQKTEATFCTYNDGKPMDGAAIYKDTIISYKNGLKHGLETPMKAYGAYSSPFDSIVKHYEAGKLEGVVKYFEESKEIAKGIYKNNSPFTGVFYNYSKGATYYTIDSYEQGKQLKSEYISRLYRSELHYKKNALDRGNFYCNDTLIANGQFKNEKPYTGSFAVLEKIDKGSFPEKYTLSSYKKGKKEGKEIVVNFKENTVEESTDFKKGNILRKVVFLPFNGKDSLVGSYKKNKPFLGNFVNTLASNSTSNDFKSSYQSLSYFESGQRSGMQYFTTNGSNLEVVLDSINYKNGKPFQGKLLEVYNDKTLQHHYEYGTLKKTNMYTWSLSKKPNFVVNYTEKGYKITNARPSQYLTNYTTEVTYNSTDSSEGTAFISNEENEIGRFSFSKNGITDAQFSFKDHDSKATIKSTAINKIVLVFELENMLIKFESTLKPMPDIKPSDVQHWQRIFYFGDGPASFYLNGEETATATCMYKEGQELNGVTANINKDGTYNFNLYKNGKLVEQQKKLTKEQLLQRIKTEQ